MDFTTYQDSIKRTKNLTLTSSAALANYALGLSGEAGEVIEHVKKHLFHNKPVSLAELRAELGDVLWYLTALADEYGLSLENIAEANVQKLQERWPDGFKIPAKGG